MLARNRRPPVQVIEVKSTLQAQPLGAAQRQAAGEGQLHVSGQQSYLQQPAPSHGQVPWAQHSLSQPYTGRLQGGQGMGAGAEQIYISRQHPTHVTGVGFGSAQLYTPAQTQSKPQSQSQYLNRQETSEFVNSIGEKETHHTNGTIDILTPSGRHFQED